MLCFLGLLKGYLSMTWTGGNDLGGAATKKNSVICLPVGWFVACLFWVIKR
jgi:hypothetical protein